MGAVWASFDFSEFEDFQKDLDTLNDELSDQFIRDAAHELAARLLAKVIPRTQVGEYPEDSGMTGGTLRRGWTGGKDATDGGRAYANSLPVTKAGNTYQIEIINPTPYASYVEFGHRQTPGRYVPAIGKRLVKSWVEGQFMLKISEDELQPNVPGILEKKLNAYLKEVFG